MLTINPINSVSSTNFKTNRSTAKAEQKNCEIKKASYNTRVGLSLAGFSILGIMSIVIGKGKNSIMTYEEAVRKCGNVIKDGIVVNLKSGEKFTGVIKRNISINKKETSIFENGQLKEKLYYNALGKELNGEFYKDGKIVLSVGEHQGLLLKSFPYRKYADGQIVEKGDVFQKRLSSVFQWARDLIQK